LSGARLALGNGAVAAVYFLLGLVSLKLATVAEMVSPIWLPAGVAFGVLSVFGPGFLPGVAAGAFGATAAGGALLPALGVAAGNTLAPWAAVMIARRVAAHPRELVQSVTGVAGLVFFCAYGASLASATIGTVTLAASGMLPPGLVPVAWLTWWLGDALGMVIIAPVMLAWAYREPAKEGWLRALELAVVASAVLGLTWLTFADVDLGLPNYYLQLYAITPFLIWLALRFPLLIVAMINLAIAAVVIQLVIGGHGVNLAPGLKERVEAVHGFLVITSFGMLALAATVAQRARAQQVLGDSEARFRALAALSSDWYWELDPELRIARVEGRSAELAGIPSEVLLGRHPWELPLEGVGAASLEDHRRRLEAHQPFYDFLARGCNTRGEWHYARLSGEPFWDRRGRFAGYRGVGKNVTAEMEARRALQVSEGRLRALVEATPDPIVLEDSRGCWIVANQAVLAASGLADAPWFGKTREQLLPLSATGLVLPQGRPGDLEEVLTHRGVTRWEEVLHTADGNERTFDFMATPLRGTQGELLGIILLGREITHIKRSERIQQQQMEVIRSLNEELEDRVQARTVALETANRELEAFSYSVSHDLRGPLRALNGFSRLLEEDYDDRLDDRARQYLERIRRASERMGELIDDLLKLSRISRSQVVRGPVDMSALARQILDELAEAEPQRRVERVVQPDLTAFADSGLVRVLLDNLLRNAWKFSRRTEAARIEFGRVIRRGRPFYFVRDNGAGFDMAYAARLFAPFQRLHHATEFEGSGIGLAIVQRIVRLHGGEVEAESSPGAGASFYFTLDFVVRPLTAGNISP
ncbi:MAG: MASE1 domain-containing protein, partial [Pseudomonadota bacterium]